jgi:hypothetical protein
MNRNAGGFVVATSLALAMLPAASRAAAVPARPNIVFVLMDDVR